MIEIGIPVYQAQDTLPNLLDTIVTQTKKSIIVCLSIDGDNYDYTDIIQTYKARGLKIRVINAKENCGPGVARQRVIDSTQCDYIMFADADDLLLPRAVEVLYRAMVTSGYDIIRSNFIREQPGEDLLMQASGNTVTWFHGKIYRTSYLKNLGTKIPPHLKVDEDAYYNLIAWHATEKRGYVDEVTYIWRYNKKSITCRQPKADYFIKNHHYYIQSQVEALTFIFSHNITIPQKLITATLINIYYYYMKAKYYKCDLLFLDNLIRILSDISQIQEWLSEEENWIDVLNTLRAGEQYEDGNIVFFQESFGNWTTRLLLQ